MLVIEDLNAFYGGNRALRDVRLEVNQGEIVCLIGSNGAGKTTLLNCISGIHSSRDGKITFNGQDVSAAGPQKLVKFGVVQVPENRQLFVPLTVEENLEMGAYLRAGVTSAKKLKQDMERIYEKFPILRSRSAQRAGTLSGGEQQMTAIGRGLMANPKLLLLDEPSLGLAPLIVREIFNIIKELQSEGCTILLVEQNAVGALAISNRAYILETGRITFSGSARDVMNDQRVRTAFLGRDVADNCS